MNPGFQFKQFYVRHDRCAMKVGTDGVLLGCWAPPPPLPSPQGRETRILDIGTGSGLIALMLAQRLAAPPPHPSPPGREKGFHIDAIDIDEAAVEQAAENFAASPWADRLHAYHSSLQEWQNHSVPSLVGRVRERLYDLIVSNPPYFQNSLKNPDKARQTARHTDTLSYNELFLHSVRILTENGILALVLPAEAEQEICSLAAQHSLYLTHITRVYSKESKPARRILLSFEKPKFRNTDISTYRSSENPFSEDTLVLEDETGGRSAAYREITKGFYL